MLAVTLAGVVAGLLLLGFGSSLARIVGALLLVLLPGYALTAALFPDRDLDFPTRFVFVVGISIAMTVASGLLLNLTPWGLQGPIWTGYLFGITLSASATALLRREQRSLAAPEIHFPFNWEQGMLLVLAAIVTVLALHVAGSPAPPLGLEGYTLLGVTRRNADVYLPELTLTVQSEEFTPLAYRLQVDIEGYPQNGPSFELAPGERWEGRLILPEQMTDRPVTIFLYRLDAPGEAYRHVVWWPDTSSEKVPEHANSNSE